MHLSSNLQVLQCKSLKRCACLCQLGSSYQNLATKLYSIFKKQTYIKKNIWYVIPKLEIIQHSQTHVTPVVADSVVVAVVVRSSNSLQLFSQQVSVKPGGDRQHPAAVAPHIDVHLWHLSEIQLRRRHGRNVSRKPQFTKTLNK